MIVRILFWSIGLFGLLLLIVLIVLFATKGGRSLLISAKTFTTRQSDTRSYILDLPATQAPTGLIVALHGYKSHAKILRYYSQLSIEATKQGYAVVYPYGKRRSWNGTICCGYAYEHHVDDIGYITELTHMLVDTYDIDPKQIHLIGFSNGGVLAQALLQESPTSFSHAGVFMSGVADQLPQSLDISQASTSLFLVHGDQDGYIPVSEPYKVSSYQFVPATQTRDRWIDQLGPFQETKMVSTSAYTQYSYITKEDTPQMIWRLYNNQKHLWPDLRIFPWSNRVPELTKDVVNFFQG